LRLTPLSAPAPTFLLAGRTPGYSGYPDPSWSQAGPSSQAFTPPPQAPWPPGGSMPPPPSAPPGYTYGPPPGYPYGPPPPGYTYAAPQLVPIQQQWPAGSMPSNPAGGAMPSNPAGGAPRIPRGEPAGAGEEPWDGIDDR
jgi:hypothetical protein